MASQEKSAAASDADIHHVEHSQPTRAGTVEDKLDPHIRDDHGDPHRAALEDIDVDSKVTRSTYAAVFFLGFTFQPSLSFAMYCAFPLIVPMALALQGNTENSNWMASGWSLVGSVAFAIAGQLIAATAQNLGQGIAGMVIIGFGTGATFVHYPGISELVPNRYRSIGLAWTELNLLPSATFGPLIARTLATNASWRWVFILGITTGMIALVGTGIFYHPPSHPLIEISRRQLLSELDCLGIFLYSAGITVFLIGLGWGGVSYPWASAPVLSGRPKRPQFPARLLRKYREFTFLLAFIFVVGMVYFSLTALISQQIAYMYSADPVEAGFVFNGNSLLGLAAVNLCRAVWDIDTGSITLAYYIIARLNAPQRDLGLALGLVGTFRFLGAAIGTTDFASILGNRASDSILSRTTAAVVPIGFPKDQVSALIAALSSDDPSTLSAYPAAIIKAGQAAIQWGYSVEILPPLSGRDIIAVGKNYMEHANEFHASGYDSSDNQARPSLPVFFTKRSSSIIAHDKEVMLTQSLQRQWTMRAQNHVWGYTIINDITARERQRDHKQFYIGKSADTYCPMGPVAVPASAVGDVLTVTTHVNGEKRQQASTERLIFSVPQLIKTLSESQTLRAGDVIAIGTPAGVGIGRKPPVFLKPSDVVEISVAGIGTLRNKITDSRDPKEVTVSIAEEEARSIPVQNVSITMGGLGLTTISSGKKVNVEKIGTGNRMMVFVHGLGGNINFYTPLVDRLNQDKDYTCLLYDFEGHGLSPTSATSEITISSLAEDFVCSDQDAIDVTIVAHSMGCLVAQLFAQQHPELAHRLVLIGPPPSPLPQPGVEASVKRAATVRKEGMRHVARVVATAGTSDRTKTNRSSAYAAVQMSLLSQDPEAYAKACTALASAKDLQIDYPRIRSEALIVGGDEDKVSPPAHVNKLVKLLQGARMVMLKETGHWHTFEDPDGIVDAVGKFI
ncbi:uncharacterized protein Z518_02305 [Rhinocladiella mackenziei CBS 650.93]|uniref:Fumarylacetoacetate hydrolase n=1 Tax=Rhinocladiella mackenziei CBS 650.93 TaxID=1442369 RepID=A0A0D2FZD8_9EURO|nr:uncharacterized protein Z518_02305 [Rhinocladiella mackenziei CBS 650.93]KIX07652.1 hypothetical protein Z518_02305 [Rhinocladiella mackenziei CBS 650.93]